MQLASSLRVAMVGLRGIPANYGGIERAVEELGSRLVRAGHRVTVFCMGRRYRDRPARHRGMELSYLPTARGKHLEMLTHAGLGAVAAAARGFDLVHVHACGPALFGWLPRLAGTPVVCTLHGQDWRAPKWGRLARAGLLAGEWAACRLPTRTTAVSKTYRRYLRDRHGVDAACIPNGVGPVEPRPLERARAAFGLEPGGYVVSVGRLTPGKNLHQLIEAFRQVETTKRLVIVGGEANARGHAAELAGMAARDGRVLLTGPLEGALLAEVFANACLFAFPTAHEGMPVALLEALAYGLPALVSDIPENLEVLDDGRSGRCGLTFRAGSVADLRDRLAAALARPEALEPLRARGPALVARRYTWDRAAARTEELYLELVRGAPAAYRTQEP